MSHLLGIHSLYECLAGGLLYVIRSSSIPVQHEQMYNSWANSHNNFNLHSLTSKNRLCKLCTYV